MRSFIFTAAILLGFHASLSGAAPRSIETVDTTAGGPPVHGGTGDPMGKAAGDTLFLMGGPDRGDGKFQDDFNPIVPDNEGWVSAYDFGEPGWHSRPVVTWSNIHGGGGCDEFYRI